MFPRWNFFCFFQQNFLIWTLNIQIEGELVPINPVSSVQAQLKSE